MRTKDLIEYAKNNIDEIVEQTKNCPVGEYIAVYESDTGIAISSIQVGWTPSSHNSIPFGSKPMSVEDVKANLNFFA